MTTSTDHQPPRPPGDNLIPFPGLPGPQIPAPGGELEARFATAGPGRGRCGSGTRLRLEC